MCSHPYIQTMDITLLVNQLNVVKGKGKAILVTGHGDP
jgi:hypothetical protein